MALKNLVRKNLVTCSPASSIQEAARLMKEKNVGAILVTENGKPKGIITDRDLVIRCIAEQKECGQTVVSDAMTKSVETVDENEGIYNVIKKMRKAAVRRIPVVDSSGRAIALLSFDDVFQLIAEEVEGLKEVLKTDIPKIMEQAA